MEDYLIEYGNEFRKAVLNNVKNTAHNSFSGEISNAYIFPHVCTIALKNNTTPKVKNIFFNVEKKTTTVLWEDGTKNIVKCTDNEEFLTENGVAMAFMNKIFGSRNAFKKVVSRGKFQGEIKDKKKEKCPFDLYVEDVLKQWKENTIDITGTQNNIDMQNDYE